MGIEKFNETIAIWIDALNSLTIHQLLIKPDKNSWSLGQVYQHIIEETNWYNGQLEISMDDTENSTKETTENARILMERGSFEDKKVEGDPLIAEHVKQPVSVAQLKSDLEKLKVRTNKLWGSMRKISSYGKSEHPGIGYLNCFEWLHYSEMHMRHHLRQKNRLELFLRERLH